MKVLHTISNIIYIYAYLLARVTPEQHRGKLSLTTVNKDMNAFQGICVEAWITGKLLFMLCNFIHVRYVIPFRQICITSYSLGTFVLRHIVWVHLCYVIPFRYICVTSYRLGTFVLRHTVQVHLCYVIQCKHICIEAWVIRKLST